MKFHHLMAEFHGVLQALRGRAVAIEALHWEKTGYGYILSTIVRMRNMNIAQIEEKVTALITTASRESFIYELCLAYGLPNASVTRLKKGNLNLSKKSKK
jgi:hypothetical protein